MYFNFETLGPLRGSFQSRYWGGEAKRDQHDTNETLQFIGVVDFFLKENIHWQYNSQNKQVLIVVKPII